MIQNSKFMVLGAQKKVTAILFGFELKEKKTS